EIKTMLEALQNLIRSKEEQAEQAKLEAESAADNARKLEEQYKQLLSARDACLKKLAIAEAKRERVESLKNDVIDCVPQVWTNNDDVVPIGGYTAFLSAELALKDF